MSRGSTKAPARRAFLSSGARKALSVLAASALPLPCAWAQGASAPVGPLAKAAKAPIFVLNSLDANVSVIDPVTFEEIRRLPTGKEPHHLYLTPDEKSLLVANAMSDTITLLDPRTGDVQKVLTGIIDPYHLRFSPDMKWFVTAANRLDHVYNNLSNMRTNTDAAKGRIMDVDYASETANMTSKQMLMQASTSMLKQSGSMSQLVMSLMQ